jgi:hypothetical protein
MGHFQPLDARSGRVGASGGGRAFDLQPVVAEHQQVEVELAWTPPPARTATERLLQAFQRVEESKRPGLRVRASRHVERDGGVGELGLVGHADRAGQEEPGHAPEPDAGERRERPHRSSQRGPGIANVGSQPDVCAHRSEHSSRRLRL